MKNGATNFLRGVLILIGVGALGALLWEPHLEGRNAHATVYQIYFHDPFLAYMYVASIPFFVGLYHGFKALGYAGDGVQFSLAAVRSIRIIKRCAVALICFIAIGEIVIVSGESDDAAGGVVIGAVFIFVFIVVAAAMSVLERILQSALELKSESDLTV